MIWLYILFAALGVAFLYYAVKFVVAALRFKRHLEEFSQEAAARLLDHAEKVDGTLERWHEYDEAYQEAVAKIEGEQGGEPYEPGLPDRQAGRGATLGPTGGSFRKPN